MKRGWKLAFGAVAVIPGILIIKDYIAETQKQRDDVELHTPIDSSVQTHPIKPTFRSYIQRRLFGNTIDDDDTPPARIASDHHHHLPSSILPSPFKNISLPHVHIHKDKIEETPFSATIHPPAVQLSKEYSDDVARLRQQAESVSGISPLPPRFTDAELMRYAIHNGFLRSNNPIARDTAITHAVHAVAKTIEWTRELSLATDEELDRYAHLVWWTNEDTTCSIKSDITNKHQSTHDDTATSTNPITTNKTTANNKTNSTLQSHLRPENTQDNSHHTLHIAIGRAVHECKGPAAVLFANVVITHLENIRKTELIDDDMHDRVNVVVYAGGASSLSASRVAWVFRAVISTLSHHYPGRLNDLVLLDLPRVLMWSVKAAKKLVRPETGNKIRSMTTEEYECLKKMKEKRKDGGEGEKRG